MKSTYSIDLIAYILPFLMIVESGNDPCKLGDKGDTGVLQIRQIYVDDVNEIYGTTYTLEQCYNPTISKAIATRYLKAYSVKYEQKTGKAVTLEVLARMHNGGPNGWNKESTKEYWQKVKTEIDKSLSIDNLKQIGI